MKTFKTHLERGDFHRIYLICGTDEEHRIRAFNMLEHALQRNAGEYAWNKETIDGALSSASEVADLVSTPPLFGGRRLVVVQEADQIKPIEALQPLFADPPDFSVLIFISSRSIRDIPVAQAVQSAGAVVEFSLPQGRDLVARLHEMASDYRFSLDETVIQALLARVGDDLLRARSEIEKMVQFSAGGNSLRAEDVDALVVAGRPEVGRFAYFDFVDAVVDGNRRAAMKHLQELLDAGESPLALLGMLARQYRFLLGGVAWQGESPTALAQAMGVKAYPARKAITQARRWSPNAVAEALEACLTCDESIKRGTDGRMALEKLTVQLLLINKKG